MCCTPAWLLLVLHETMHLEFRMLCMHEKTHVDTCMQFRMLCTGNLEDLVCIRLPVWTPACTL